MVKRRHKGESDCTTSAMAEFKTILVDTSLNTNLAMVVHVSDTVLDFKKKMVLEHMKFFPKVGEIQIHSLKGKRRGNFYHLPDPMLVSSAFDGVKGNWFLSADVSSTGVWYLSPKSSEPETSKGLKMDARSTSDDECRDLSFAMTKIAVPVMSLPDAGGTENNFNSEMTTGLKVEESSEKTSNLQRNSCSMEDCMETESRARSEKKCRMKQSEDACDSPMVEDNGTLIHESLNVTSRLEIVGCENSMVNAVRDVPESILNYTQQGKHTISEATEVSGVRNDQPDIDGRVALGGGVVPAAAEKGDLGSTLKLQSLLPSDKMKENITLESVLFENSTAEQTAHLAGVNIKEPNLSTGLADNYGMMQNDKSNNRKRKRAKKAAAGIQDTTGLEHEAGVTIKEPNLSTGLTDSYEMMQDDKSNNRKRKRAKKTAARIQDTTGLEHEARKCGSMEETCIPLVPENSALGSVANFQNILASDRREENIVSESLLGQNVQTDCLEDLALKNVRAEHSQDVAVNKTNVSLVDTSGTMEDTKSDGVKRKKKKSRNTTAKVQDSLAKDHETGKGEARKCGSIEEKCISLVPENSALGSIVNFQNILASDRREENIVLESLLGQNVQTDHLEDVAFKNVRIENSQDIAVNKTNVSLVDSSGAMEDTKSDGIKRKKKKSRNTTAKIQDSLAKDHETGKGEARKCGSMEETCISLVPENSALGSGANFQNIIASDRREENIVLESSLGQNVKTDCLEDVALKNVRTEHSQDIVVNKTNVSLVGSSGTMEDTKSDGIKRKKKKSRNTTAKIQDSLAKDHETGKGEFFEPYTETHKSKKNEEESRLFLSHDHEVIPSQYSQVLDCIDPDMRQKEAKFSSKLLDANMVTEPRISSSSKKKMKKKSTGTNLEKLGMEPTDYGMSGTSVSLCSSHDHIPEVTGNAESVLYLKGEDVKTKLLDRSSADASERVQSANGNEANFVTLTQTGKSLQDGGSLKKKMGQESGTPESEKTEIRSESTGNKDKKAKKRRKKNHLTASDAQGNLPVNDQKVGVEVLATEENSTGFVNPQQEQGLVASSQVLSNKNQEKLEAMNGTAATTDDQVISFKQYFVPGASGNKVKEATKSNSKMKTEKKVRSHNVPSVSTSTEQQNSLRSCENKSRDESRRHGELALNSNCDEVSHKSIHRSLEDSGNGGKGNSAREMQEMMTVQNHKEILAASSFTKENNSSLVKSSSERSETFSQIRGEKKWQSDLNVNDKMVAKTTQKKSLFAKPGSIFDDNSFDSHGTDKMVMKTPQRKSLFSESGSIFQDNSGEGSGDENGSVHSDASTRSPSKSSSESGYSEGESDSSQHSTRNGSKLSNDGKGRLTDGKSMSESDLSASQNLTIDMILRSSKQFKKAKKFRDSQTDLEQNESQAIEFVPDSQANP